MSLYSARRDPFVLIKVNGKPAPQFEQARIGWRFVDQIYRRDEGMLELADPNREFRDRLLVADDHFIVAWGYPGNMSRPRGMRLKEWFPSMDDQIGMVRLQLEVTGKNPRTKVKNAQEISEPHKSFRPKNWGKIDASVIAKRIARRHGLKFKGDKSDDIDNVDQVQAGNVTDYQYLRRLAENIDFEFFIEDQTLFFRKKPYGERPRREFIYYPDTGADTLLLRFDPKVKVTSFKTQPRAVDVAKSEDPWTALKRSTVELGRALFFPTAPGEESTSEAKGNLALVEKAVDTLTTTVDESWVNAEQLREILGNEPDSITKREDYEEALLILEQSMTNLQTANQEKAAAEKPVKKQTRANRSQTFGKHDGSNASCPKDTQKTGSTPTGQSRSTGRYKLQFQQEQGTVESSIEYATSDSTVRTTDGTAKKRKKVACAAHSKRKDKAVTARAEFIGDPSLRAKVNYSFRNVGRLFDGSWYAKEAVHEITDRGYSVSMQLKRGVLSGKNKKGSKATGSSQSEQNRVSWGRQTTIEFVEGEGRTISRVDKTVVFHDGLVVTGPPGVLDK